MISKLIILAVCCLAAITEAAPLLPLRRASLFAVTAKRSFVHKPFPIRHFPERELTSLPSHSFPEDLDFLSAMDHAHRLYLSTPRNPEIDQMVSTAIFQAARNDPVTTAVLDLMAKEPVACFFQQESFRAAFTHSDRIEDCFSLSSDAKGKSYLSVRNGLAKIELSRHNNPIEISQLSKIFFSHKLETVISKATIKLQAELLFQKLLHQHDKTSPISEIIKSFRYTVSRYIGSRNERQVPFENYKDYGLIFNSSSMKNATMSVADYCKRVGMTEEECLQLISLLEKLN